MWIYFLIGAIAGLVMGVVGVGGGALIIFLLAMLGGFSQKLAQGTTLFVVAAPISLFAAWKYYADGYVNVKAGGMIMVAFLGFSIIGAHLGTHIPSAILKKCFGIALILMGIRMLLPK